MQETTSDHAADFYFATIGPEQLSPLELRLYYWHARQLNNTTRKKDAR